MGQGPYPRDPSTRDLSHHESYFCRRSSMFVTALRLSVPRSLWWPVLIFSPGRDYDYQTLNLTFAVNVVKYGLIISLFPKPLRLCVITFSRVFLVTEHNLVLFHACYQASPHRFINKLNLSDPWSRRDLRKWRSMGRTGMINQFVTSFFIVSLSLDG